RGRGGRPGDRLRPRRAGLGDDLPWDRGPERAVRGRRPPRLQRPAAVPAGVEGGRLLAPGRRAARAGPPGQGAERRDPVREHRQGRAGRRGDLLQDRRRGPRVAGRRRCDALGLLRVPPEPRVTPRYMRGFHIRRWCGTLTTMNLRDRYDAATAGIEAPFAVVDLAAFRANAASLVRRAAGKPIRVASKSVRCRPLLEDVLAMDGFAGVMAFTLPEALWLARKGVSDDILVAYPTTDRTAVAALADDPAAARAITLMVDCPEHLDLIESAAGGRTIRVCIDIDAPYPPLAGRARTGALRSPLRTPAQVRAFAETVLKRPSLHLAGLMAYESQIAGVGDVPPGRPARGRVIRAMQQRSRLELARRRAAIVRAVG